MPKAKELRPFVERLITIAKRGLAAGEANGQALHARRLVHAATSRTARSSRKLFDTIAPRFAARPGGYTRLLRIGYRRGDSAEVAQVELVGSEFNPNAKAEGRRPPKAKPKAKGVGGRLRAAAERLRGKKADGEEGEGARREESQAEARRRRQGRHDAGKARQARDEPRSRKSGQRMVDGQGLWPSGSSEWADAIARPALLSIPLSCEL